MISSGNNSAVIFTHNHNVEKEPKVENEASLLRNVIVDLIDVDDGPILFAKLVLIRVILRCRKMAL